MKNLKILILALSLATTPLLFSGCGPQPQVVYVTGDCPELQQWAVDAKKREPLNINYKVKDVK